MTTHESPNQTTQSPAEFDAPAHRDRVQAAIRENSYMNVATTSSAGIPHVAGVLYLEDHGNLYFSSHLHSVKVRNVLTNGRVAVSIPVPSGLPDLPFAVQFQGKAEVVSADDPGIQRLQQSGRLEHILAGAEADTPGVALVRVAPGKRVATYGIGFSLEEVMHNPTMAIRSTEW